MQDKLICMARELLAIDSDLPSRFDQPDCQDEHPTVDDFELHIFEQTWGSTALGFNVVGGQAMTTANTYVFIPLFVNQPCFVYFGARFAYSAHIVTSSFKTYLSKKWSPFIVRESILMCNDTAEDKL